ncbi:MAG: type IV pilus twitching motility protein PilT [Armatimonadetes bacterium]|nr:type IV pilus twitching motility protein PilT [Armatimonadota bacterium]
MSNEFVDNLLRRTYDLDGSDLHLKTDNHPLIRVYGDLHKQTDQPILTPEMTRKIAYNIMNEQQQKRFEANLEMDLAYEIKGLARFRTNMMMQRGHVGIVMRLIPSIVKTMEELFMPPVCKYFCERPRGMVLVTGPTGSGKSTTLAAMINYINTERSEHIMTVEDPIEFVHECKNSLINQRELGTDTLSFANALKYVLRQNPDVILVGEMRDLETIHLAITAAETGHLVFATLHTPDAVQTVDRIIDVFPTYQQSQIRQQLANNMIGIVSQNLLRRADGKGRIAAFETLVNTPAIRNLIREGKTFQVTSIIQTGGKQGMMTLDQYLGSLVKKGLITMAEGLSRASNVREFNAFLEEGSGKAPSR